MKKYYQAFLFMCMEMNYDHIVKYDRPLPHLEEKINRYKKLLEEL